MVFVRSKRECFSKEYMGISAFLLLTFEHGVIGSFKASRAHTLLLNLSVDPQERRSRRRRENRNQTHYGMLLRIARQ